MNIGRNQLCPCGSGKKYKNCCIGGATDNPKHHFRLKGKKAEEVVHDLAQKTFLTDWCYLNPILPNSKELCDLLIVFDDIAIIWQIKDLKLHEDGKFKETEVEQNLRQLSGARRRLFEMGTPITLENPRRGKEKFDATIIKEVYLISALLGGEEEEFSFYELIKKHAVHVFNRNFTQVILRELDTISDFCNYLRAKEALLKTGKRFIINGGEEELLAFYLFNNRGFKKFDESDFVFLEQGIWKHMQEKQEYIAKKKEDKISYGWDSIIEKAHQGPTRYEIIARELARPNRFKRRYLSKNFLEACVMANSDKTNNSFRRVLADDGITYCFVFADGPRKWRAAQLAATCKVARVKIPENKRVLGIATEKQMSPVCSYDFCLLDIPELTEEYLNHVNDIQKKTGILTNPTIGHFHDEEYPQPEK